ncbi:MAG: hypothetical protein RLZZ373_3342 [Pseudomonadota bacterium]|jgi:ribosomal protein S19E (S16A)
MPVHDPIRRRRGSVLASLYFAPMSQATVRDLQRDLEQVHNVAASRDAVRADLSWLQEVGMVKVLDDTAQITERGRDVARNTAPWPGE